MQKTKGKAKGYVWISVLTLRPQNSVRPKFTSSAIKKPSITYNYIGEYLLMVK